MNSHDQKTSEFYAQILQWVKSLLDPDRTVLIGINGPQGCGKSTLCESIVKASPDQGFRSATLSIDDFYLTRSEQVALAARNPNDPTLQQRGYPGTHDIKLGAEILTALKKMKSVGTVLCPQYDKSAHSGQGDRFPKGKWKNIQGPLDILLFEGWMLGYPITSYQPWHNLLDGFLFLDPKRTDYVLDWRVQAEERRKAEGKAGMTKEEITAYVKKFIPAYEKFLPLLRKTYDTFPNSKRVVIGSDRLPTSS